MRILLWAEFQKLRRSNMILFTVFVTILLAVIVFVSGATTAGDEQLTTNDAGWYLTVIQVWATIFVLPGAVALFGSYMICREERDDTMKALRMLPVNETQLTAAKMLVTFLFSIFIYLLLFAVAFFTEAALHLSDLSVNMLLGFLKMFLLEGVGVFLAVSPIIAAVPYLKNSYWLAMAVAEIYSFAGLFMSMSNTFRTFYPVTAVFGVAGYYDTTVQSKGCSLLVLLLCGSAAVFLLKGAGRSLRGEA